MGQHRQRRPAVAAALTVVLFGVLLGSGNAQWLYFEDRAADRLELSSVPADDDREKDIAIGDFNRDGWTDVIVARKRPRDALVLALRARVTF